jgi:hypothetical protein
MKRYKVPSLLFTLLLGLVLCVARPAFAWTLYYQLGWEDSSYSLRDDQAVAENLTNICNLSGFPQSITFLMYTGGTSYVNLMMRLTSTTLGNPTWYSQKTITITSTSTLQTFTFASSTMPDFSICPPDFTGWFFQLDVSGSPLYIYGTNSTSTLTAGQYNIPTAYCVNGGSPPNCGTIGDNGSFYFYIDGDTTNASSTLQQIGSITAEQCNDWGTIGGAFCKVLVALFLPSQTNLEQFSSLKDSLLLKPPFGYWTSIKTALNGLNASSSPAFSLASVSAVSDNIFNPLKTGLSWILWILFGLWVIRRIGAFVF